MILLVVTRQTGSELLQIHALLVQQHLAEDSSVIDAELPPRQKKAARRPLFFLHITNSTLFNRFLLFIYCCEAGSANETPVSG